MTSQWGAFNSPTANFFLLPTRAWELAIGASISVYFLYNKKTIRAFLSYKIIDEILGAIGLVLIGYSIFSFNETIPFPSFFTLIPTVGAGLIILFSSKTTLVGKLLGSKILVGIGLVSYSAYLWHQPIFAFYRHRSLTEPTESHFLGLILLTFFLAYFSWKYVEKPFRVKGKISRKNIFLFGVIGTVFFIVVGVAGQYVEEGFNFLSVKNKFKEHNIEEKWKVNHGLSITCEGSFTLSSDCRTNDKPEILIWGDSYAMHLVQGIIESSPDEPKVIQMTKSNCGPFFDIAPVSVKFPVNWAKDCLKFTGEVRKWIKENNTINYVVVSSPFSQYISKGSKLLYRNGNLEQATIKAVNKSFNDTLSELESLGVTPIVFSPPPANGIDIGRCLAKAEWIGLDLDECNFNLNQMTQSRKKIYFFLKDIEKNYRVIRLDKLICDKSICKTHFEFTWLYRDKSHLSHSGSAILGRRYGFYNMIVKKQQY